MTTAGQLPTVIDDLSAYVIAGRVKARASAESETAARTPAQGIADGVEAEQIGFRRVFVSERWNLKEAAVLLGAIGARTSRIDLGTGLITTASRHLLHAAAFGSTMQAAFGPRFVLGLGRADASILSRACLNGHNMPELAHYVEQLRALWDGRSVPFTRPDGEAAELELGDVHDGPHPRVWFGTFGQERGAAVVAQAFDGVLLVPNLTPSAAGAAATRIRRACERIGRDPAEVRIAQCLITAPGLDEAETRQIAHARTLTYLHAPVYGEALVRANKWDPDLLHKVRAHPRLRESTVTADLRFHRSELADPATLVPDEWINESCAIGTVADCVRTMRAFRDAGVDEIVTYGSTPGQNRALPEAWREASTPSEPAPRHYEVAR